MKIINKILEELEKIEGLRGQIAALRDAIEVYGEKQFDKGYETGNNMGYYNGYDTGFDYGRDFNNRD